MYIVYYEIDHLVRRLCIEKTTKLELKRRLKSQNLELYVIRETQSYREALELFNKIGKARLA